MTRMMKAACIHEYGSPEVLVYEDAPVPTVGRGEVLVKVKAAGINPIDWKTRDGHGMTGQNRAVLPLIVGWDIAGVVEAVGEDADKFKIGDAVFGMVRFPDIGSAYAEYVAAPQTHLALKSSNIDFVEAAAFPLAALTAWQTLFETGNLSHGERVLIQGAAGGVGHLAVQLAKWKGAHVIGTSSTSNIEFLRELGVDEVIDYSTTRFEDAVEPVDLVLSCISGDLLNRSLAVIKEGGRLVSIVGKPDQPEMDKYSVKVDATLVHTVESHLNEIAHLIETGHLKTTVAQVFNLSDADKAHAFAESRTVRRGKIVMKA